MERVWLCLSILEASPDLILSSSMCNECEFSHLGSDEGLCLSPVSVGSGRVVASCVPASFAEVSCQSGQGEQSDGHFAVHSNECTRLNAQPFFRLFR